MRETRGRAGLGRGLVRPMLGITKGVVVGAGGSPVASDVGVVDGVVDWHATTMNAAASAVTSTLRIDRGVIA